MSRERRKGQNEAWFRELNERLEERAVAKSSNPERFEIICECDTEECTERITIGFVDYEAVRARPTEFVVVAEHGDPTCEVVVSSTSTYDIVEKIGDAAAEARAEDPRHSST